MNDTRASSLPSVKTYMMGFGLAVVLTALPFSVVHFGLLPRTEALLAVAVAAIVQILVHLRYFLHLDLTHTPRENLLALSFAALLIVIMVGGSLWIMFDLHDRMM